ncbi:nucleoporin Nup43-like isoform X2 [Littorina saxatilis]
MEEELLLREPELLCEARHPGDVSDLCFLTQDHIATASSTGSVLLYKHHTITQRVEAVQEWPDLHISGGRRCPCTCLATYGEDTMLSGGEDGRIAMLSPGQAAPVRVLEKADSCTINALAFLKQSEVLTVNSFGQLKLFDFRQNTDGPAQIFSATDDHWSLLCVDKHPGQLHVVATGSQDGTLTVWDLRQNRFPMTTLDAHQSSMWEVRFHPYHAEHLFTCSEDGSLWHWDASAHASLVASSGRPGGDEGPSGQQSPWLGLEASPKLEINSLICNKSLSVNSLDIEGGLLLCGTDSENIYTLSMPHLS